jgi:predicted RecA/RadA family phage recombinase
MAKNYIAPSDPVTVPAPAGGVVSGTAYLIGALFGVAGNSAAQGLGFPLHLRGVWELPKTTGINWLVGAKLYWDNTAKAITNVAAGNTLVGTARNDRVNADTVAEVILGIVA